MYDGPSDREVKAIYAEGEREGFRKAIAVLRDTAAYMAWAGQTVRSGQRRSCGTGDVIWAADFLESRLSAGPDLAQVVARERDLDDGGGR